MNPEDDGLDCPAFVWEPLCAIAGGILGGASLMGAIWALAWRRSTGLIYGRNGRSRRH